VITTEQTLSVSSDGGAFEWSSQSLGSMFNKPSRIFDLGMWRMLFDVARFNTSAVRVLGEEGNPSIGEYLKRQGYSTEFRDNCLIPMTAAVWSTPPDVTVTNFPAKTLIRFLYNHDFLQITSKPIWLTVKGGSKKYVDSILSELPAERRHLSTPVQAVSSGEGKATLVTATGKRETFDHIIFACHTDDALRILDAGGGATPEEREILGVYRWSKNDVWLHSDVSLMPRVRSAWSSWNYIKRAAFDKWGTEKKDDPQVAVSYWMNDIQSLPAEKHGHLFVTLNPPTQLSPKHVLGRYAFAHPVLSGDGVHAARRLVGLNANAGSSGRHRVFAGAWTKYGFHEDGFASGLRAAAALPGVVPPFTIVDADQARGEPRASPIAYVFDVLDAIRAYFVLIVASGLFLVVVLPVLRK